MQAHKVTVIFGPQALLYKRPNETSAPFLLR